MKKYLILLSLLSILSCKKNTNPVLKYSTSKRENLRNKDSTFLFKKIGNSNIKSYEFPKEWSVNTYNDNSYQLKKTDVDAEKKLKEVDYFNMLKGVKNESTNVNYLNFIKKDSLLNLAKVDSLFLIDSRTLSDGKQIKIFKTVARLDDDQYDVPINIYKINLILVDKSNVLNSINVYSEIDFPYATRQNICYLDKDGKLFCRKFSIEEMKVINNGSYFVDLKKLFNIK